MERGTDSGHDLLRWDRVSFYDQIVNRTIRKVKSVVGAIPISFILRPFSEERGCFLASSPVALPEAIDAHRLRCGDPYPECRETLPERHPPRNASLEDDVLVLTRLDKETSVKLLVELGVFTDVCPEFLKGHSTFLSGI